MLSRNFKFIEKDDVPYAIERIGGRMYHMVHRNPEKWEEIQDSDRCCHIQFNGYPISEHDALLLADEFAEDIAELKREGG